MSRVAIIAAIGRNRALGLKGKLLWRLPDDMQRFKETTTGHPVIMGRKTWESIPEKFRPLPERTNIIVTRQTGYEAPGATMVSSLPAACAAAARAVGSDEIFVIGGGEIYSEALPIADRLYLTLVDDAPEADSFFPAYEDEFVVQEEVIGQGAPTPYFKIFERK